MERVPHGAEPGAAWHGNFAMRVLVAVTITLVFLGLGLLLWRAANVLLIAFAGILVAVGFYGLSERAGRYMRLPPRGALLVTLIVLALLTVISVRFLAPRVATQIDELVRTIPRSLSDLEAWLTNYAWGRDLLAELQETGFVDAGMGLLSRATGLLSGLLVGLGTMLLVLAIGIYAAAAPELYIRGFVKLFPKPRRARAREVVGAVGHTMRWWLLARGVAMLAVGGLSGLGLWLLDVPLALALGVIAGLSSFIPNIGFFLAGILILLFAASQGLDVVLRATAVYLVVQGVEGYLITPLVEHRAVNVPPALNMTAQVLMALLFGLLGLILAAPLVAVAFVVIRMIYLEDILGDRAPPDEPSRDKPDPGRLERWLHPLRSRGEPHANGDGASGRL